MILIRSTWGIVGKLPLLGNVMNVYQIDDGEWHWYAADTFADAIAMHCSIIGEDEFDELRISKMADHQELIVRNEDDGSETIKSCEEWANERGPICSTAY